MTANPPRSTFFVYAQHWEGGGPLSLQSPFDGPKTLTPIPLPAYRERGPEPNHHATDRVHSAAMRVPPLIAWVAWVMTAAAARAAPVGDPARPAGLGDALRRAYAAGDRAITVRPGTYALPPDAAADAVLLDGWRDATVTADGVTLIFADYSHRAIHLRRLRQRHRPRGHAPLCRPGLHAGPGGGRRHRRGQPVGRLVHRPRLPGRRRPAGGNVQPDRRQNPADQGRARATSRRPPARPSGRGGSGCGSATPSPGTRSWAIGSSAATGPARRWSTSTAATAARPNA